MSPLVVTSSQIEIIVGKYIYWIEFGARPFRFGRNRLGSVK